MADIDTLATQMRSVPEVAERFNVSVWTVFQLIKRHELASLKIGSRRLIPETAVDDYITRHLEGNTQR
jgi:excisionase family DNA binding protein